jgi:hypothetical protein
MKARYCDYDLKPIEVSIISQIPIGWAASPGLAFDAKPLHSNPRMLSALAIYFWQ